jgi:hypothetical protein
LVVGREGFLALTRSIRLSAPFLVLPMTASWRLRIRPSASVALRRAKVVLAVLQGDDSWTGAWIWLAACANERLGMFTGAGSTLGRRARAAAALTPQTKS